jgi:hypothetical protein
MTLIKQPFVNYTVGEKDPLENGKIFTIRLNSQEYRELLESMEVLNISSESTAIKELAFIGKNVLFSQFKLETLRWLTDGKRRVDESKLQKLVSKIDQNVIQK